MATRERNRRVAPRPGRAGSTEHPGTVDDMLFVGADPRFADHDPGRGHPERPARLEAVHAGMAQAARDMGADTDALVTPLPLRDATVEEITRIHTTRHVERLEALARHGGGSIDLDTAITAAALAERGERVLIVDYDAHHGNGTQEAFYADPRVAYVSFHEWPLYPGTGRLDELGSDGAVGTTCNVPLPAGATGDLYLRAVDELVAPLAARHTPDWVLVSCGFDAHRADPLTGLGLSAGDYGVLATRMTELAPRPGRVIVFLEGGYDLDALRDGTATTVTALVGEEVAPVEPPTSGGPGREVVDAATDLWREVAPAP